MTTESKNTMASSSYNRLLKDGGFQCFLWTQFLGAFNDNVYKMIVSVAAVDMAAEKGKWLALAGAVFVIPFLLFAGWSGQLADRFSKTKVLIFTKAFEMLVMTVGIAALISGRMEYLLVVLFMLAIQANFFSPAKYGILPEMLPESDLSRANGLLEMTTFAAIVLGASVGTLLYEHWKLEPLKMGSVLLLLAVIGSLTSLGIPKVKPSGASGPIHWNPFAEIIDGTKRMMSQRTMWLTVVGITFFWFVGALFQMNMLIFGRLTLGVSESDAGLLAAALAVGIAVGSVIAGKISGDYVELGLVPVGSILMGIFALALSGAGSFNTAAFWLVLVGLSGGLFIVPLNAYLQERPAQTEKGRLIATNNFYNMLGVISASGLFYLLDEVLKLHPRYIFAVVGLMELAVSIAVIVIMPELVMRFGFRAWLHTMFDVKAVGKEFVPTTGAAMLISNHSTFIDTILTGVATPRFIRWMVWRPYYDSSWGHWFFSAFKSIPVSQNSKRDVIESLRAGKRELESGELVGIFPEGSLTRTGNLLPFQRGFERIVEGTGAPIIPVWIDRGVDTPFSVLRGLSFTNWGRPWRKKLGIYYGEPMDAGISPVKLREVISEMGSTAWTERKEGSDVLPVQFAITARRNWKRIAIADSSDKELTYGECLIAGLLIASWLDRARSGEQRIGLLLPSSVGGVLANLGIAFAARTSVNLNYTTGPEVLEASSELCELKTIFTTRAFLEKAKIAERPGMVFFDELMTGFSSSDKTKAAIRARFQPAGSLSNAAPDDIATVIFSSGSTDIPKGVQLTHFNVLSNLRATAQVFPVNETDCLIGALPLFHSFGYCCTMWFPLLKAFKAVYHYSPMDAKVIGELAEKHRGTFLVSTPTFCAGYLRKVTKEQFAHLRWVIVAAEKMREAVAGGFREKYGVEVMEGYGCTEMSPVISLNVPDFIDPINNQKGRKPGTVGCPIPGTVVKVVDPDTFQPLEAGAEGLLLVKSPSLMAGYLKQPELTSRVMYNGFYITGDIGVMDDDGFLKITDRLARFSKIGGEMVPHVKVEEALHAVLGDAQCHVASIPDHTRGERLVVLYSGSDMAPAELWKKLSESELPALWIPKKENYYAIEAIPSLGSGKTDLRGAKKLAATLAEQ